MKFLIDHADVNQIRDLMEYYPIDGVTTNPSILKNAGNPPMEALLAIRDLIGPDRQLHCQVVSQDADGMCAEARHLVKAIPGNTFVKIPSTQEGFKAMKILSQEGIQITATIVFTPMQAYLAAKCGVKYVAPYVNHISNSGHDSTETVKVIQDILDNNGMDTQVIAANFRNAWQLTEVAAYGVGAITASPDTIRQLGSNAMVDTFLARFTRDFESLAGAGRTMVDF